MILLYWVITFCFQKQDKEWKPEDTPLVPITSNHFVTFKVTSDCTVKSFCEDKKLERSCKNLSILLEFNCVHKSNIGDDGIRDVILRDKVLQHLSPSKFIPVFISYNILCRKLKLYSLVQLHVLIQVPMIN